MYKTNNNVSCKFLVLGSKLKILINVFYYIFIANIKCTKYEQYYGNYAFYTFLNFSKLSLKIYLVVTFLIIFQIFKNYYLNNGQI